MSTCLTCRFKQGPQGDGRVGCVRARSAGGSREDRWPRLCRVLASLSGGRSSSGTPRFSSLGTRIGFVLAVLLYRLFAPADPHIALALLPLAFIQYVIQGVGQVRADAGMLRLRAAAVRGLPQWCWGTSSRSRRSRRSPLACSIASRRAGMADRRRARGPDLVHARRRLLFGVVAEVALALWLLIAPSS